MYTPEAQAEIRIIDEEYRKWLERQPAVKEFEVLADTYVRGDYPNILTYVDAF